MSTPDIGPETPALLPGIRKLLVDAFRQDDEADLVERLRATGGLHLARAMCEAGRVCGYAAVSPMVGAGDEHSDRMFALAPVAVAPDVQGRGLGNQVVRAVIAAVRSGDAACLTVLGDPDYYARFGFEPADRHGITIRGADFGPAFQVLNLGACALSPGIWRWHPAFDPLLAKGG